ncbi:MAG TPA: 3-oxoacyl-[acyl-carrier-protein] synthase III C-terminal domain-containing protein, partial [Myxococcota bacterium]|nr:3-oxoacyl-[acyl-carrier-protein] synthase III C-terminal domain-containing protein [Myxococcota bacterium]
YDQETLTAALAQVWGTRHHNVERLASLHRNVLVGGRHLALPMEAYAGLGSFTAANDAFIGSAVDLGERAVRDAVAQAGLGLTDIDHIFFVSVTGLAVPSVDARLVNRLGLRPDVKRTPIFGLGCVAGAAGLARAADYVKAYPDGVALLVSVELCSLTLQREDLSIPNIIASGLFGDGAAAVLVVGSERCATGPRVLATRSVFYPDTERVMGWDITSEGFRIVLSAEVPQVVQRHVGRDVDAFLADLGLCRADLKSYVCHPGGPKVLAAFAETMGLPQEALAVTSRSLATVGNLSSASVLMVLRDTMQEHRPPPGSLGLMMAMGPGFCSELVLLKW